MRKIIIATAIGLLTSTESHADDRVTDFANRYMAVALRCQTVLDAEHNDGAGLEALENARATIAKVFRTHGIESDKDAYAMVDQVSARVVTDPAYPGSAGLDPVDCRIRFSAIVRLFGDLAPWMQYQEK